MSEYYDGKYGPAVNNQQPAVSDDHVIASGFYIQDDGGMKNVYCPCGKCFGEFKDVTWGHGASGLLFLGNRRLDIPSPSRMIEIKAARKILIEAEDNKQSETCPACGSPMAPLMFCTDEGCHNSECH